MRITRHDMPCDAMGGRLSGGWPSPKGNAQQNHASPHTATEALRRYRHASIHHANLDLAGDAVRDGDHGAGIAASVTGAGDVHAMKWDFWRECPRTKEPDHD